VEQWERGVPTESPNPPHRTPPTNVGLLELTRAKCEWSWQRSAENSRKLFAAGITLRRQAKECGILCRFNALRLEVSRKFHGASGMNGEAP
jgi:hypothetical protein